MLPFLIGGAIVLMVIFVLMLLFVFLNPWALVAIITILAALIYGIYRVKAGQDDKR